MPNDDDWIGGLGAIFLGLVPAFLVPDGKVDMRDIGLLALHYGEHYV